MVLFLSADDLFLRCYWSLSGRIFRVGSVFDPGSFVVTETTVALEISYLVIDTTDLLVCLFCVVDRWLWSSESVKDAYFEHSFSVVIVIGLDCTFTAYIHTGE